MTKSVIYEGVYGMPGNAGGTTSKVPQTSARTRKSVGSVVKWLERRGLIADNRSADRLVRWLARESNGSMEDLVTPLFGLRTASNKNKIRRDVAKQVESLIVKDIRVPSLGPDQQELIFTHEMEQAENISEQSSYLPWSEDGPAKVKEIYDVQDVRDSKISLDALDRARDRIASLLPRNSIGMVSFQDAIGILRGENSGEGDDTGMDKGTNSGLPYVKGPWWPKSSQRGESLADSKAAGEFILRRAHFCLDRWQRGEIVHLNAIVGKRLAQKKDPLKRKRLIIALEKAEPVVAKTFTSVLLPKLAVAQGGRFSVPPFVALTDIPVIDLAMQRVLQEASKSNRAVISGDYSGYDRSLRPWFMQYAAGILAYWVKGGKFIIPMVRSMTEHTMLVTPDHIWLERPSAMKSGSGLTNILDSLCNLLIIFYGQEIREWTIHNVCVQGDDFILDAEGAAPENLYRVARLFNVEANPDKQYVHTGSLMFLQRLHFLGYLGGIASIERTIGSAMSYERLMATPEEWRGSLPGASDVVRTRAQLENTAMHPAFEDFVRYVASGDKYKLYAGRPESDILAGAGTGALEYLRRSGGAQSLMLTNGNVSRASFMKSATGGVLDGERLPPPGSRARWLRVYNERATAALSLLGN
uniref:Putative replicase n=1 Tax=Notsystermes virus TaxID=2796620 RepID=A0A7T7K918_9VIRU|nr:putative replicase [Notsystermes virus]